MTIIELSTYCNLGQS